MTELEVRLNLDEHYQTEEPNVGMLVTFLDGEVKEEYLNGRFRQLVKYVMNSEQNPTDEQSDTCNALREKIANESDTNRLIIKLYDENDEPMVGQVYPAGDIYLDDIVRDKVGDGPYLINIGISSCSSVGWQQTE
jgi:hypothetical protein